MEFLGGHTSHHRVPCYIHLCGLRTDRLRTVQDGHVHQVQRTAVQCVASLFGSRNHRQSL